MFGRWRKVGTDAPWQGRDGAGLLELSGDLFMLGGWNANWPTGQTTTNQVWRLPRGRETWERLEDAPWSPRHTTVWLVHDGKLWVVGGDMLSGYYQKDVWCGEVYRNRVHWVQVSAAAPWATLGRVLHVGFSHSGKIFVLGGQTTDQFVGAAEKANKPGGPYYDDVWSWSDGAGWQQVSAGNAWAPRGLIMGAPVKDGKMWLIGGGAYDTPTTPRVYRNDVWCSDDAVNWQQVTASAPWAARQYNNTAVLGDELVLFAGWNGANMRDLWSSKDGVAWRQYKTTSHLTERHAASLCRRGGELVMLGGPLGESSVNAVR